MLIYVSIVLPQENISMDTSIWAVYWVEEVGDDNSSIVLVRKEVILVYDKHHQFITWYNVWNGGCLGVLAVFFEYTLVLWNFTIGEMSMLSWSNRCDDCISCCGNGKEVYSYSEKYYSITTWCALSNGGGWEFKQDVLTTQQYNTYYTFKKVRY